MTRRYLLLAPGRPCDRCAHIPADGELIRGHSGLAWICRVCAYPTGGAPGDEEHAPSRIAPVAPVWPSCISCGSPIFLVRAGRDRCVRCAPEQLAWPVASDM